MVKIHHTNTISETLMAKGAPFTSSFEEECTALELALQWIKDNCNSSSRPLIVTDSQSMCRALVGFDVSVDHLLSALAEYNVSIGIQWCPVIVAFQETRTLIKPQMLPAPSEAHADQPPSRVSTHSSSAISWSHLVARIAATYSRCIHTSQRQRSRRSHANGTR